MERLTKRTTENQIELSAKANPTQYVNSPQIVHMKHPFWNVFNKLAEYEEAEEQGLLLRLPYNLATCGKLYYVDERDSEIYELTADKIEISKMMISGKFIYAIDCYEFVLEDFGKIVFKTKAEAEKALAEMG